MSLKQRWSILLFSSLVFLALLLLLFMWRKYGPTAIPSTGRGTALSEPQLSKRAADGPSIPVVGAKTDVTSVLAVKVIPSITLGELIGGLQQTLGPPSEMNENSRSWSVDGGYLTVRTDASGRINSYFVGWGAGGKLLQTPDGVLLGHDTLVQVREKLKDRILTEKQDFGMEDGVWFLTVYVLPQSGSAQMSGYNWYLNDGIPAEAAIVAKQTLPHTAEMFKDVPVNQYEVDAAAGGAPLTHHK